jgi:hypothetical protein
MAHLSSKSRTLASPSDASRAKPPAIRREATPPRCMFEQLFERRSERDDRAAFERDRRSTARDRTGELGEHRGSPERAPAIPSESTPSRCMFEQMFEPLFEQRDRAGATRGIGELERATSTSSRRP